MESNNKSMVYLLLCSRDELFHLYMSETETKIKRARDSSDEPASKNKRRATPYVYKNVYLPMFNRMHKDECTAYLVALALM